MEQLLHIAEEVIQLLPDELFDKYMQLRHILIKDKAIQDLNYENEDISMTSLRNKLSLFQYLREHYTHVGVYAAQEARSCGVQVADEASVLLERRLEQLRTATFRTIGVQCENEQQDPCKEVQTAFELADQYIQATIDAQAAYTYTEARYEAWQANIYLCRVLNVEPDEKDVECQLLLNVQRVCDALKDKLALTTHMGRKIDYLRYKTELQKSQNTEMEQVFKQLVREADKLRGYEGLARKQEAQIRYLEATIAELTTKLQESGIMQKQAQEAYFQSIQQLKRKSDAQVEQLQMRLAYTHDRLRRMQKSVESVDTSVFDSLVSM